MAQSHKRPQTHYRPFAVGHRVEFHHDLLDIVTGEIVEVRSTFGFGPATFLVRPDSAFCWMDCVVTFGLEHSDRPVIRNLPYEHYLRVVDMLRERGRTDAEYAVLRAGMAVLSRLAGVEREAQLQAARAAWRERFTSRVSGVAL